MANAPAAVPRLLFVLDNDYGGLGLVMYFLHGQALAANATLLLPPGAHELHEGRLPVAHRAYRSLRDIVDAVEGLRPQGVVLVSGYLFPSQGVLRAGEVGALVRALRARGCQVATTDPYLGTFRRIPQAGVGWLGRMKLAVHVRRLAGLLEGLPQIYPSPMDPGPGAARRLSFFNPLYVDGAARPMAAPATWLFVLARFDLELQEQRHGRQGFAERVAGKIRETLAGGRHATFIGPGELVERIRPQFGREPAVTLLARCPFDDFERRLMQAEFAFYWQLFPTSAFMRLWNGLPAFFFDRGHNSRRLETLHEAGLRHYHLGGAPTYLDIERPLDAGALAAAKAGFERSGQEARRQLARLPEPGVMVEALLEGA